MDSTMKKPWDKELTTKTDGIEFVAFSGSMPPYNTVEDSSAKEDQIPDFLLDI